ncbi:MAG: hypothetical protein KJ000_25010 [Pirellulaceae bacterium]|nr:hypothetical protein [Pirellulaceae bacterium]
MRRITRTRRRIEPFTEQHRRYLAHIGRHVAQFTPPGRVSARLVDRHPYAIERELIAAWAFYGPSIMADGSGKQSWGFLHFGEPKP